MEKIKKNEIKKASKVFTEIFKDYEAYDVLFGRKNRLSRMYYLFRAEVYCAQNFTYKDGDFCALCSIKTPSDKEIELKSAFKKGLKKETYKNIKNWNIVHEIANRYHCSFLLYDREFSFTVIADSLSNLDFEDLDMEGIEELNQK